MATPAIGRGRRRAVAGCQGEDDMDGTLRVRLARVVAGSLPRRATAKVLAGGGLAAAIARFGRSAGEARRKKRRCRKRGQTCGGKKKCCDRSGLVVCREFPTTFCPDRSGRRCCGLDGAGCSRDNPVGRHCDCCDGFGCNLEGRCQEGFV
jgi:hypothetical protein